jgi:hypothetical protein
VEVNDGKWSTENASAYIITDDGHVSDPVDLLTFLKPKIPDLLKDSGLSDYSDRLAISFHRFDVHRDGEIFFRVVGQVPKGSVGFEASVLVIITAEADGTQKAHLNSFEIETESDYNPGATEAPSIGDEAPS